MKNPECSYSISTRKKTTVPISFTARKKKFIEVRDLTIVTTGVRSWKIFLLGIRTNSWDLQEHFAWVLNRLIEMSPNEFCCRCLKSKDVSFGNKRHNAIVPIWNIPPQRITDYQMTRRVTAEVQIEGAENQHRQNNDFQPRNPDNFFSHRHSQLKLRPNYNRRKHEEATVKTDRAVKLIGYP